MILLRENVKEIWFSDEYIYLKTVDGVEKSMPLRWFPRLAMASANERFAYKLSPTGIHWEGLDEDLSFEVFFTYNKDKIESEKNEIQKLLSVLNFINLEGLSVRASISPTLMRHYACGIKKPSDKRANLIKETLRQIGKELMEI